MKEERREEIERSIERFKSYRKCRVDFYMKWDGVIPDDQLLPEIKKDIEWAEEQIMKLREQLPPPMSQRQLRAIEEIPKVWAEVTSKKVGNPLKEMFEVEQQSYNKFLITPKKAGRAILDLLDTKFK